MTVWFPCGDRRMEYVEQNESLDKKKKLCDKFLVGCPYNQNHECVYEEGECFIPNDE
jgi:hypothetical protein